MRSSLAWDESGVAVSVGFILLVAVTAMSLVMILLSFNGLMQSSEDIVVREEFRSLGIGIGQRVERLDSLVGLVEGVHGNITILEWDFRVPPRVAGNTYVVNVTANSTEGGITLVAGDIRVEMPLRVHNARRVKGVFSSMPQEHTLKYNRTSREIIIE